MTEITQVKWEEKKPKLEDVDGKTLLIWRTTGEIIGMDMTGHRYDQFIANQYFKAYAILSDDQRACEWVSSTDDDGFEMLTDSHGYTWSNIEPVGAPYCRHCGLPIHIVDELKPLPLMGIEPEIMKSGVKKWSACYTSDTMYFEIYGVNECDAIESWNSLVKQLAGEK